jgi:hypothetical protein
VVDAVAKVLPILGPKGNILDYQNEYKHLKADEGDSTVPESIAAQEDRGYFFDDRANPYFMFLNQRYAIQTTNRQFSRCERSS